MGVGQLSESDAVDDLRLPFYSSSHPTGSHGWRNQFDLGNPDEDNYTIKDFTHQDITVAVGTAVAWTNRDSFPHTTTEDSDAEIWDSLALDLGESFKFTFTEAGTFSYFCAIHPTMTATVTVTGQPAPTNTATREAVSTPEAGSTPPGPQSGGGNHGHLDECGRRHPHYNQQRRIMG